MIPTELPTDPGAFALALVRRQCEEIRRHELTLRHEASVDAVHDMRVATRRLRAAIRGFAAAMPPAVVALDGEVRWLGRVLGVARDLDVQIELLAEECAGEPLLQPLLDRLQQERRVTQRQVIDVLNSERYSRLLDDLCAGPEWSLDGSVEDCARHAVADMRRRARHQAKELHGDSPGVDYHRLRKGVKRLRYVLEASEPVLEHARDGVDALQELQDRLGRRQDADTAIQTYSRLMRQPELTQESAHAAEEHLRDWQRREQKQRRKALRCLGAIDEK